MVVNRVLAGRSCADRALGAFAVAIVALLVSVRLISYVLTFGGMPGTVALSLLALCAALWTWLGAEVRSLRIGGAGLTAILACADLDRPQLSWSVFVGAVVVGCLVNYALTGLMLEYASTTDWR